jgi:hypothetical protein
MFSACPLTVNAKEANAVISNLLIMAFTTHGGNAAPQILGDVQGNGHPLSNSPVILLTK